jgi:pilus assembly protein CpaE
VSAIRVVAIGGDESFRPRVARALLASPDTVAWAPTLPDPEVLTSRAQNLDLVILGPTVGDDQAVRVAERLANDAPATAVVFVRGEPANGSFPRLVRAGIRDVVDLDSGPKDLEDALRRATQWSVGIRASRTSKASTKGKVVSVFSTKGGTGKTFLACNLAVALAMRLQQRVAIVDSDHDLGDVFAYFNVEPRRSLQDLAALDEGTEKEAVVQLGTPMEGNVVAYGSSPDPRAEPIHPRAMEKVLHAVQDAFSFVVVDGSAEYSDHVLAAFDLSDVICLVTSLDVIGVRHMSLGMQTLENLGIPRERFRVVLNRADSKVELTPKEIERILHLQIDAAIPSSPLVPRSINRGQLLMLEDPRSDVARSISAFAGRLVADLTAVAQPKPERRRLLSRKA